MPRLTAAWEFGLSIYHSKRQRPFPLSTHTHTLLTGLPLKMLFGNNCNLLSAASPARVVVVVAVGIFNIVVKLVRNFLKGMQKQEGWQGRQETAAVSEQAKPCVWLSISLVRLLNAWPKMQSWTRERSREGNRERKIVGQRERSRERDWLEISGLRLRENEVRTGWMGTQTEPKD